MWALILLMQAGSEPPARIDLTPLSAEPTCTARDDGDIIVCGERDGRRYRLKRQPAGDDRPARAEMRVLGDATAAVEGESAALGSGITIPRLMARLKIPF